MADLARARDAGRRASLKARYALEGEFFRRHPELNRAARAPGRGAGMLEWARLAAPGIALTADYVDTQTPSELNALAGLEIRAPPGPPAFHRRALHPSRGPAHDLEAGEHRFNRDRVVGLAGNDTHAVLLGLDRRFGPSDPGASPTARSASPSAAAERTSRFPTP